MKEKPVISICLGSSCYRRGNQFVLDVVKNYLTEHNLTHDVIFKGHLCAGKCMEGPIITIDNIDYEYIDSISVIRILDNHLMKNNQ